MISLPWFRRAAAGRGFEQLTAGLRQNRRARQQPVWRPLNVELHIVGLGTLARQQDGLAFILGAWFK